MNLLRLLTCATLMTILLLIAQSCNNQESDSSSKAKQPKQMEKKEELASEPIEARIKNGKKLYNTHCSACHLPNGVGISGLNPPLIETEWVTGDKKRLINIVINGLEGEIEVNGQKYPGPMLALPYLKDDQVADILTYVRNRFGKGASPVTKEEVQKVRG